MHRGCRTFLITAAAALVLAPTAAADSETYDLYVARDSCGSSDVPANLRLDTELGAFTDGCGPLVSFAGDAEWIYPSKTGALQTLDTTRTVYASIVFSDATGAGLGVGEQHVTLKLTAKDAKNKTVTLASATHTRDAQTMLRGADYTDEYDLPLKPELKGPYKAFTLTLTFGGSALAGYVDHGGGSFVSLPIVTTPAARKRVNRR